MVYKLSEKERVFLVHSGASADLSMKDLAARTGMREHSVRRIQDLLLSRGLIVPVYFVDMYRLGYTDLGIFFSRGSETSTARKRLEEALIRYPAVTWLAKMGGAYQYALGINVHAIHEVQSLFELLRPTEEGAYFTKTVRIGIEWLSFSPNFLLRDIRIRHTVELTTKLPIVAVDEVDLKVLQTIADNTGVSIAQMARIVKIPVNTFAYRFERLKERGIIKGMGYVLATEKLGILNYRVLIVDRGLGSSQRDSFLGFLKRYPNVGALKQCTGSWDFELRFESEDSSEIDRFSQEIYDNFGSGIDSVTAVQQFRVLKRRSVPLA
jgi:DNA-binding Lrp family transcriptional regulator